MNPENKKLVLFDFFGVFTGGDLEDTILSLYPKYLLAIVSSSSSKYIKSFLTEEKIEKCFNDILGSDLFLSKVKRINNLLEKYKISPENVIYITDTLGDIREAKECNVKSIGVTWGVDDKKTLEKGHPIAIIDEPMDLFEAIKNVLK